MDEFSSAVGGLSGAASLGGAGGAFSSLIPSAAPIPDLFPRLSKPLDGRFERFYRVLSFEESKSVPGSAGVFKCLGIGGFGAVFDVVPTPAAYAEDRITTAIPENTVLAMKQVYVPVDRDLAEKIWKREAELLFDYRYRILADPLASATICVPVDAFRYPTDGGMKVLMRIVMFRSPLATPFSYGYRAEPGKNVPPHEHSHKEEDFESSSGADMMKNPYAVPGSMTKAQVHYVMRQLLTALAFMHFHGLIHRDVKTSNLLVWGKHGDGPYLDGSQPIEPVLDGDNLPWVKLADFGMARAVTYGMTLNVGTKSFIAPEVTSDDTYTAQADIFSAGCLLYHLVTGEPPLEPPTEAASAASAEAAEVRLHDRFPRPMCFFRETFVAMVNPSPRHRPDAARLLESDEYFGKSSGI